MATTMNAQQMQSVFPKSHVGFDSITNQIEKKLLKRGFQFNVICVGTYSIMHIYIHNCFPQHAQALLPCMD